MDTPPMPTLLTPAEAVRLKFCEEQIASKLNAFMDVGAALVTIRQQRLYRAKSQTFEEYCVAQFGFTDRRARQYMDAFETVFNLSAEVAKTGTTVPLPTNEAQARELAKAEPAARLEVLKAASEKTEGEPTAKAIKEAVAELGKQPTTNNQHPTSGEGQAGGAVPPLPLKKFNFGRFLEKISEKIFELADHAEDQTDLESIEEELRAAADKIQERRMEMQKQKAA